MRFGYHPLPAQTIVDGHIMNAGAIVDGLDRLFHKVKRRDVALRVSGHSVIIKKITMPLMTAAELAEQINWEAEQHIPFELADVQIDYQVVTRREDQGQMDVLLVAAKKEEIGDLTNLALEAKLRPQHRRPRRLHRAELLRGRRTARRRPIRRSCCCTWARR